MLCRKFKKKSADIF